MLPMTTACWARVRAKGPTLKFIRRKSHRTQPSMRIRLSAMKNGVASSMNEDTEAALARPSPLTTAPPAQPGAANGAAAGTGLSCVLLRPNPRDDGQPANARHQALTVLVGWLGLGARR